MEYIVNVIDSDTNEVVKSCPPVSTMRQAEKLAHAHSINLNTDKYFVDIQPVDNES